jgi:succinate dehydrogenase hydrophobic anchor subunit
VVIHPHLWLGNRRAFHVRPGRSDVHGRKVTDGPAHLLAMDILPQFSNIPDVTLGWANAFWQIMQYLIIFFAFTHAANGIRMIVEDYVGHTLWQPFVRALIALLWMGMLIVGIYVVLGSAY